MGAYPPPPPPPSYPPPYGRDARRAQRRMAQDQARFQRAQLRNQRNLQRRLARRRSVAAPLLLLALGLVFLLVQLGTISWPQTFQWYGRWWPAVLIACGFVLLAEWALDRLRPPLPGGVRPGRAVGGGLVFLLILLVLVGLSFRAIALGMGWSDRTFGPNFAGLDHVFGDRHDSYSTASATLPAGAALTIRDPRGDVTVTGASTDGQIHVNVHAQAYAWKNGEADRKIEQMQPTFSAASGNLLLAVQPVDGGRADLIITVPPTAAVTVNAGHGDVDLSTLQAPVALSADHGDVEINDVTGAVRIHVNDSDANLTLRAITGPVSIKGHSGDIDISQLSGALTMQGDFYGSTELQQVSGPLRFETSRTQFRAAALDGEFSVENDSLDGNALLGPVVLKTSAKNITLDRVQGDLAVTNSDGSVEATLTAPSGVVDIENRNGSVNLGLPASAAFSLNARTRNGDMENDFGLTPQVRDNTHALIGTSGGGGPAITLATSDGDITVRKSVVAPLPAARAARPTAAQSSPAPAARKHLSAPLPPGAGAIF